ncbi:hypothetical protein L207DRAFT_284638 [Hyaloscypha variabilis F]|uniref:Uncharacterized protein n=1 Tax=Hyaloscypha variabilis (strain UAMH 11265 / GT02V1 / F) TaxID=1149755 RepID=A0A2J6S1L6_HYAVF|nr:hypothetical protein L207DRAFT_284638 [Hyaloscypha variabilis F]
MGGFRGFLAWACNQSQLYRSGGAPIMDGFDSDLCHLFQLGRLPQNYAFFYLDYRHSILSLWHRPVHVCIYRYTQNQLLHGPYVSFEGPTGHQRNSLCWRVDLRLCCKKAHR